MFNVLRPLVTFEAQRQVSNRRSQMLRFSAIALAALYVVIAQQAGIMRAGMTLVGSGLAMLNGLAWLNYLFILSAACGLFATAITQERESGTLPLLMVADIPFRPFVLGKWVQFLSPSALIVLMEIPLLASATFFGA